MLKSIVPDHFYNSGLSKCTFEEICQNLRGSFEGLGYHHKMIEKCNGVNLPSRMAENT